MAMNTPVHPGAIVREDCLLGLSVTEGAKRLGIGRQTLAISSREGVGFDRDGLSSTKAFGSTPDGSACSWPSSCAVSSFRNVERIAAA